MEKLKKEETFLTFLIFYNFSIIISISIVYVIYLLLFYCMK